MVSSMVSCQIQVPLDIASRQGSRVFIDVFVARWRRDSVVWHVWVTGGSIWNQSCPFSKRFPDTGGAGSVLLPDRNRASRHDDASVYVCVCVCMCNYAMSVRCMLSNDNLFNSSPYTLHATALKSQSP